MKLTKKNTDHNHDKYITTPEFNKFMAEIFILRLKRANLGSKSGIANFVIELNELSEKSKAISPKRLTKELIDKFSILNGAKYFSLRIFKNYVVLMPAKKYIKYFIGTTRIELVLKISWNVRRKYWKCN